MPTTTTNHYPPKPARVVHERLSRHIFIVANLRDRIQASCRCGWPDHANKPPLRTEYDLVKADWDKHIADVMS